MWEKLRKGTKYLEIFAWKSKYLIIGTEDRRDAINHVSKDHCIILAYFCLK